MIKQKKSLFLSIYVYKQSTPTLVKKEQEGIERNMCRHEQGNESNKPGERRDPNVSSYKKGPSRGSYLFFLPWLLGSYT